MAEYLSKVTGGRSLPDEVVEELQHRYAQIGLGEAPGEEPPPLTRWTLLQAKLLQGALAAAGKPLRVYAGMRNWHPFIGDVVTQMRTDGISDILAICLAPQNSRTSIGLYRRALMAAVDAQNADESNAAKRIKVTFVESWSDEPRLVAAFAQRLAATYSRAREGSGTAPAVLFTAHSVPCRTIMTGEASVVGARPGTPMQGTPDPYPVEAKRTADLVFDSAFGESAFGALAADTVLDSGTPDQSRPAPEKWYFAFQSQGVAGGPWIGPTVEDTLAAIAAEGCSAVILQPVGFLCDHVEILYDVDIAFAETARSLGLRLYRPESLNGSPLLTEALVRVVMGNAPAAAAPELSDVAV
jgi:ferrochelatase